MPLRKLMLAGCAAVLISATPSNGGCDRSCLTDTAGQISQVEAVLLSVPYGMRPGWSSGVHLPSPAAERDGFREY